VIAERGDEIRHQPRKRGFESSRGVSHLEAITAHVESNIGPVATVQHEIVSDLIHLALHPAVRMWFLMMREAKRIAKNGGTEPDDAS